MKFRINDKIKHVKTGHVAIITGILPGAYEIQIPYDGPGSPAAVVITAQIVEEKYER